MRASSDHRNIRPPPHITIRPPAASPYRPLDPPLAFPLLIEEAGPQGLIEASKAGDLEAVIGLLAAGADVEAKNKVGGEVIE